MLSELHVKAKEKCPLFSMTRRTSGKHYRSQGRRVQRAPVGGILGAEQRSECRCLTSILRIARPGLAVVRGPWMARSRYLIPLVEFLRASCARVPCYTLGT